MTVSVVGAAQNIDVVVAHDGRRLRRRHAKPSRLTRFVQSIVFKGCGAVVGHHERFLNI